MNGPAGRVMRAICAKEHWPNVVGEDSKFIKQIALEYYTRQKPLPECLAPRLTEIAEKYQGKAGITPEMVQEMKMYYDLKDLNTK